MRLRRRLAAHGLLVALTTVLLALVASPAGAEVTEGSPSTDSCFGQATIDGTSYDTTQPQSDPIVLPADADDLLDTNVPWQGAVTFQNTNNLGGFDFLAGPWGFTIADWGPNPNTGESPGEVGDYDLREFYDALPFPVRGQFLVRGEHYADGGFCIGIYLIEFEGGALDSPITLVGIVGAGFSLVLLVISGRRRAVII